MTTEPRKGMPLVECLIILAIALTIGAIAVPGLMSSRRASNERDASTALKAISSAEADFRANDRDWNRVNDFWTGDVKSLYTMTAAAVRGPGTLPKDPPIRLIELETAAADADPSFVPAGGENMAPPQPSAPRKGYWFAAMILDLTLMDAEEATYKADTGGTPPMGKCHNTSKFGFVAVPNSDWSGKYVFLVNENNTIFRQALTGKPTEGSKSPPGLDAIPKEYLNWPDDSPSVKNSWHRPD